MNQRAANKRLRKRWNHLRGRLHTYDAFLDWEIHQVFNKALIKYTEVYFQPSPLFQTLVEKSPSNLPTGITLVQKFDYSGLKS